MVIRQETAADIPAISEVIRIAFAGAEHTDGQEHLLVSALRASRAFIPELSLVAVEQQPVGHVLFTKARVNGTEVLALAPLAVLPAFQRRGIGLALIRRGHEIARGLGYPYAVVLGHAQYYPKAGYVPASRYGIRAPFPVQDENFMAICLGEQQTQLNGVLVYDPAFGL